MKPRIERGQIWWIQLGPTRGSEIRKQRPCVVVSANPVNQIRRTPVVVPLSQSAQAAPPIVVALASAGGNSVAVVDQIRAVDRSRFVSCAGALAQADLTRLGSAIKQVLSLR